MNNVKRKIHVFLIFLLLKNYDIIFKIIIENTKETRIFSFNNL
jgi:hypothetical protein